MVSVIIPVYNTGQYLVNCIESVLNQSLSNFELILVDDGSPDHCGEICDKYAQLDKRVKVIHQPNAGQAAARNVALDIARGEYICFVDSDDAIHLRMLEFLFNMCESNHADMSVCCCKECSNPDKVLELNISKEELHGVQIHNGNKQILQSIYQKGQKKYWVVWGKLLKKSLFNDRRFEAGRIYEDNEIVCKLLWDCDCVVDCDLPLYCYRQNPYGTTGSHYSKKKLDELWAAERRIEFFHEVGYEEFEKISYKSFLGLLQQHCKLSVLEYPEVHMELKKKLINQLRKGKSKYGWTTEELASYYETVYPKLMWLYWQYHGLKNKLKRK